MKQFEKAKDKRAQSASLLLGLLLGVSITALNTQATAQTPTLSAANETRLSYDIPAQPLSSALTQYARQSDLRVLVPAHRLAGLAAPSVHGSYSREEALGLLLAQSGVVATIHGEIIEIDEPSLPQPPRANEIDEPVRASTDASVRSVAEPDQSSQDLVVTGTRIRGARPVGANLITLDREEIEQTGRSSVEEVLRTAPQVFPGSQNDVNELNSNIGGANMAYGSTVDLRGLGADATLTLVNGRRLAPAAFGNFVDISAIPLAAVERVEILADGASATYGSDAIGGVVNIITRENFDGAQTSIRLGGATDGGLGERAFSHVQGFHLNDTQITLGYEFRLRDSLATEDRAFAASSDLRPFGGSDFSNNRSSPGNITRIGATNVVLAIPDGQDGASLSQADLLVGVVNLENRNLNADLAPTQERHSVFGSLRHDAGRIELFADVFASRREAIVHDAQLTASLSVPETNFYRQLNGLYLGQGAMTILYSFADDLGPIRYDTSSDTISLLGGVAFDLSETWRLEATATLGRHEDVALTSNTYDSSAIAPLLASGSAATAFNPFSSNGNSPASVLAAIRQRTRSQNLSELSAFSVKADGVLLNLPAGALRVALGAERRLDEFEIERTRFNAAGVGAPILPSQAPGQRTTEAYFVEAFIPLLHDLPLIDQFDLSFSARREQSNDYGAETTPRAGFRWAVNSDLVLRGAWGTSFKAPRFDQLYQTTTAAYSVATPAQDPFATNGSTGLLLLGGGNASLEPEDAETWTAGFDYSPQAIPGLSFSATYFEIDFANRIGTAGSVLTAIRNPVSFASVLFRTPTPEQIAYYSSLAPSINGSMPIDGVELIFDGRLVNVASQSVRGLDIEASYAFETPWADARLFATGSNLLEFTRAPIPNAPTINLLNTLFNPIDWRVRAGLSLSAPRWRGNFIANFANEYRDTISAPVRRVLSWTTYDMQIGHALSGATFEDEPRTELSLSIQNLFNEDPPFVNNTIGLGFDAVNASPNGRVVSVELRRRW